MASSRSVFAALLRAWRDRLPPADAGFTVTTGRRAPGLRREELAQLAGLSVDYVLRLEQGRAKNPSAQVVGALARALQLSRAERDQLYRSAGLLPPQDGTVGTHVPPGIQRLAARLDDVPIGVFSADWTLVWWNTMWRALYGDPTVLPAAERNLARALFGNGAAHALMLPVRSERGQDTFEASIVADLKDAVSRYPADAQLDRLVRELREVSEAFARQWATETAAAQHTTDRKTIRHPETGDILLDCDVLVVPGADLRMVTYTAATGSSDAGKLDLLRVTRGHAADALP
ncbi:MULTISPECIES: helix-turn-helix transcriptional regulator [unclassified Streptomyces]|uniref:helix-turn-helix transcriptional regulator n=1 Tax=unclassified Streptomyces TaxID=2593676 RepID=UPI002DDB5BD4|nr:MULTISPECIES: helix-turn-helix transcriptional regulator [unclassified Streptomyces]WSA91700.1 helix-turn-helix transcriptional regulator [Streptomyces sp. NBC_01795]WSB76074.1 helix-turn-helix transcriptional regulator [Streptomyces sp. NBC_01775]WSS15653.1 helix-turn-helix transcriptional regulator [Streptomyces sp. NBC_01186]WSS44495.1 helix-turn-helix transcriptional regulator [Streptomyces sp. NBC_01187]